MTVHQFLPTWEAGGVGAHALGVARALGAAGIDCVTWADDLRAGLPAIARESREFLADGRERRGAVLLYHAAAGTPTADLLAARTETLVVDHHNVTPPAYFDGWEPALAENLEVAEHQVARLARRCTLGLADSSYNARELARDGCTRTAVVPVLADYTRVTQPDPALVARLRGGAREATWLFVGRLVPNKAQHDVVAAFACYRALYDTGARLRLVGDAPFAGYASTVRRVAEQLGVAGAVEVTGPVDDRQLAAHYAAADVFVSLSRHEGFGVPLVEAMAAGLPVVALAAAAVPETVGPGGLLLPRAEPALVAAACARVLHDAGHRDALVRAGRARAAQLAPERAADLLLRALGPLVAGSGAGA